MFHDRYSNLHWKAKAIARVAAPLAAVSMATSCQATQHAPAPGSANLHTAEQGANGPHFNRCFNDLLPTPPASVAPTPSQINLTLGAGNYIQGDPGGMDSQKQAVVADATVQIETSSSHATGFILQGKNGEEVIATAAHALIDSKGSVTAIDDTGQKTDITGGCYVYETDKSPLPLTESANDEEVATGADIAILTMAHKVGGSALTLQTQAPERGSWVFFTNDQSRYFGGNIQYGDPTRPSEYTGLVLTDSSSSSDFSVLTGVEPALGAIAGFTGDVFTVGGSGGEVTNGNAGVIGMSVGSNESQDAETHNIVQTQDLPNVSIDPRLMQNPNFTPVPATLMPASIIAYVVKHGTY